MQTDRAARQACQLDRDRGTGLNRELEPFLLEDIREVLLSLRATLHQLSLYPIQVGCGDRATVRKLRSTTRACRGRYDPSWFIRAAVDRFVEADITFPIGRDVE